jgi:hypothetical protein
MIKKIFEYKYGCVCMYLEMLFFARNSEISRIALQQLLH